MHLYLSLASTFYYYLYLSSSQCALGRNAGTPLHHAAKKGLEDIVNLLLSHGGVQFCHPFISAKSYSERSL